MARTIPTFRALIPFLFLLGLVGPVFAADISLTIQVTSHEDNVVVSVLNTGSGMAKALSLELELDERTYHKSLALMLPAGKKVSTTLQVAPPYKNGTYPLITRIFYLNDGKELSVIDVGYFNWGSLQRINAECELPDINISRTTTAEVPLQEGYRYRLFLPSEIQVSSEEIVNNYRRYSLVNNRPEFNSTYTIYGVLLTPADFAVQAVKICSARLTTRNAMSRQWWLPDWALAGAMLWGLMLSWYCFPKRKESSVSYAGVVTARYGFSVFLVSSIYLAMRKAYLISVLLQPYVLSCCRELPQGAYVKKGLQTLLRWLYFSGGDYDVFFRWVADPLFIYMLSANWLVLYYLVKPIPAADKYWHLMRSFFSLPGLRWLAGVRSEDKWHWEQPSRLAILSLMVKSFYLPLLCSWTVNQILTLVAKSAALSGNFFVVNSFLVDALILVDVSIFAVGYMTELPQLGNSIRSVEPTVFGWFVCLMCYPPFNGFSFDLMDVALHENWQPDILSGPMMQKAATLAITLLWGVYVWATVALGFKSSNLTNRGIVDKGPYRYLRHPAYVSKVSVWTLSSLFRAEKNFYLIISFIVVYALRAWTEERHLSRDADYLEYKKRVPWVLIPRLF